MHCISLAILSQLSRFPSPAVGTNWPFCVDVPLKHQSINQSSSSGYHIFIRQPLILISRGREPITVHSTAIKQLADESIPSDQNPPGEHGTSDTYKRASSLYSSMDGYRPSQAIGRWRWLHLSSYIVRH